MSTDDALFWAYVVIGPAVGWCIGCLAGWAHDGPWNWRVLAGPKAYYGWRNAKRDGSAS